MDCADIVPHPSPLAAFHWRYACEATVELVQALIRARCAQILEGAPLRASKSATLAGSPSLVASFIHSDDFLSPLMEYIAEARTAVSCAQVCVSWNRNTSSDSHHACHTLWSRLLETDFGVHADAMVPQTHGPMPRKQHLSPRQVYAVLAQARADCYRHSEFSWRAQQVFRLGISAAFRSQFMASGGMGMPLGRR